MCVVLTLTNHFYIRDPSGTPTVFIVKPGYYSTVEELLQGMKEAIDVEKTRNSVTFLYNKISRRVTIKIKNGYKIIFPGDLGTILGFKPRTTISTTTTAENIVDLEAATHFLYVYTDVVQPQVVGDSQVPLIRIIPVEGKDAITSLLDSQTHSISQSVRNSLKLSK
jgi:hypothetical protein